MFISIWTFFLFAALFVSVALTLRHTSCLWRGKITSYFITQWEKINFLDCRKMVDSAGFVFDTKWLCNWPYSCDIHNNDWIFSKTIKCFPNHQNTWHAASLISNTQNDTEKTPLFISISYFHKIRSHHENDFWFDQTRLYIYPNVRVLILI